jgi:hypothetical protein
VNDTTVRRADGFGIKVDDKTDRSLDLDTRYRIIRSALTEAASDAFAPTTSSIPASSTSPAPLPPPGGPVPRCRPCNLARRTDDDDVHAGPGPAAPERRPVHELSNVLMTPHVSGWIDETREARARLVAEHIDRSARDEPPPLNLLPPAG